MQDRDWLIPSVVLTAASGLVALMLIPEWSGITPAIAILPLWMVIWALLGSIYGYFRMIRAGVEHPIAHVLNFIVGKPRRLILFVLAIFIAGLNMTTFMWTKPLLNHLVPFRFDPLFAQIDHMLFLGRDPWTMFTWLNNTPMAIFYHRGWFAMMILVLTIVVTAPSSPTKSATMLTYFALWSVLAPVIHLIMPAAGPIFYAHLGYGDRFVGLGRVSETREMAVYLWRLYAATGFGPGSGISAMPSMHIATTVWMILAVRTFARQWLVPMAVAGGLMFLLSMALGWHYAIDGIVGALAALGCQRLLHLCYSLRSEAAGTAEAAIA